MAGPGTSSRREASPGPLPFVLSAKSPQALRVVAERLLARIEADPGLSLADLSFSLATTRAQLEQRAVAVAAGRERLLAGLGALAKGEPSPETCKASATSGSLACLFTGQGSQRPGMGRGLYETYPAYAAALDEACAEIDKHLDLSLEDLIFSEAGSKEAELLDHTTYAQPALFATELALHRLLESFGLEPDLLTGHSVGEIVAAHISGVFNLPDAAKLICARGALMGALPEGGAMLAIEASEAEALAAIGDKEELLSLAAVNGPTACVISGDAEAIEEVEAHFKAEGRKTKRLQVSHAFHSPLIEPMLEQFSEVVSSLSLNEPKLPVISNLTGEQLTPEQATDPAYWTSHAREPVRFADAVATLRDRGTATFLELGPDAVLTAMAAATLEGDRGAALISSLREGRAEPDALVLALASAHAAGAAVDWDGFFAGTGACLVDLPTYPFQRRRFWIDAAAGAGDLGAAGLTATGHPLLSAAIEDPGGDGVTLSGRIGVRSHPWLADHVIFGTPILPGTAFLELALEAARRVGCEAVIELALQSPLVIPESDSVQLQVTVGAADQGEEREIAIHSRREGGEEGGGWVCHAIGTLGNQVGETAEAPAPWPPPGAEPVAIGPLYERLADNGFEYGAAFQKTRAAWRRGNEVFAELLAPDPESGDSGAFGIHPILLDAAFHAALVVALDNEGERDKLDLPFTWNGARIAAAGAATMRVRIEVGEKRFELSGFDAEGNAVIGIEALITRALDRRRLRDKGSRRALHRPEWVELALPAAAEPLPGPVLVPVEPGNGEGRSPAELAGAAALRALERAQEWIATEPPQGERMVFLTKGALVTGPGEEVSLEQAPLAGLLRSAHAEYPGRFALVDLDDSAGSARALDAAVALTAEEPELALREGRALARRLSTAGTELEPDSNPFDPDRTVLVSGGIGGIGALLARHLVAEHGVRRLLLAGRRGAETPGAGELEAELRRLGAEQVTIAACDVADRDQLERLLDSIPAEHPLGAVIHSAGVLDDCLFAALDGERLARVMRPKVEAAWNLHELTAELDLSQFVMFSSAAGLLGGPSQANYAAANAFLDGLAAHRRLLGLPGLSLAWGLWEHESGMSEELTAAQGEDFRSRVRARLGFIPLPANVGLELFDAALAQDEPLLAPVEFDPAALGARARAGALPPVLRGLVRVPPRPAVAAGTLAAQLEGLSGPEREDAVLALVRSHVAAALGNDSPDSIPAGRNFKELGFDSLSAVELRNRLGDAVGVRLPATIAFDHPSIEAMAKFVLGLAGEDSARPAPATVRRASAALDEPIAIVGMSCRLPGGANSPSQLWELLAEGRDAIAPFPSDRGWDLERLYDPDPDVYGTSYAREGGFVERPGEFDAGFFEISPREALAIDPQQRVLLESSWEALEDAGIDPTGLHGGQTGVFAGVMYHDYGVAFALPGELEGDMTRVSSGSFVAGRVAYTLGLEGPAMSVDTACSSSLVTIHLACQSLRRGECPIALAGGSILATPGDLHRVPRAARPLARRPLQVVLRGGGRHRFLGGGRHAGARAPLRRRAQRPRGPGDDPRLRRQPGRRLQRADRAQRPLPGAGDPPGPGQRAARAGGDRSDRGPRHGNRARRPDRGDRAARHLRPGPRGAGAARLGQVEPRSHPGGGGGRGRDQDRAGDARGRDAEDPARRGALLEGRLGGRLDRAADRGAAVESQRAPAPRRRLLLRRQRHQRTSDLGGGARGRSGPRPGRLCQGPLEAGRSRVRSRWSSRPNHRRRCARQRAASPPTSRSARSCSRSTSPTRSPPPGRSWNCAPLRWARSASRSWRRSLPSPRAVPRRTSFAPRPAPAASPASSPARAPSERAWAGSCTRPTPPTPRRWMRPARRSTSTWRSPSRT